MSIPERSRSVSDHFLPAKGEDFLATKEVDNWVIERGLVMWRLEKVEDTARDQAKTQSTMHEANAARINALEIEVKYQMGKIVGGALIGSFLLTVLLQYLQVFG